MPALFAPRRSVVLYPRVRIQASALLTNTGLDCGWAHLPNLHTWLQDRAEFIDANNAEHTLTARGIPNARHGFHRTLIAWERAQGCGRRVRLPRRRFYHRRQSTSPDAQ